MRLARISSLLAGAALALLALPTWADEADAQFRSQFLEGALSWDQVLEIARAEGQVQFYYWGGDDNLNVWVDSVVAPAMAQLGITLRANRLTATKDAVDLVIAEAGAGRGIGDGSVDAIWLNGENFLALDRQQLLFGPFAQAVPNGANFAWDEADPRAQLNSRDFGTPTGGQEIPWSGEQYVCAANRALLPVADTPSTFEELRTYLQAHPGKFTYVKPPHYLGNTFVQQVLYAFNPDGTGAQPFQKSLDELGTEELARLSQPGLDFLKDLEPLLLGGPDAVRYPEDAAAAQGLFRNGEIHLHCEFGLYAVATRRDTGAYPETAEEIIFPQGQMIKNKSYIAIPSNTPNPAAALVLADYMASLEAQISKLELVGYPAGIDPWQLDPADAERLAAAAPPHFGVTQDELDANIAADTNASLVDVIEASWLAYVERKSTQPLAQIMAEAAAALAR